MDALIGYKTMPQWHKDHIKDYLIYDGIYNEFPSITEEDARFIHKIICDKVHNNNVNPYSIASYLTDNYTRGNISKNDLENANSGQIVEAVYYDKLYYLVPYKEEIEISE